MMKLNASGSMTSRAVVAGLTSNETETWAVVAPLVTVTEPLYWPAASAVPFTETAIEPGPEPAAGAICSQLPPGGVATVFAAVQLNAVPPDGLEIFRVRLSGLAPPCTMTKFSSPGRTDMAGAVGALPTGARIRSTTFTTAGAIPWPEGVTVTLP